MTIHTFAADLSARIPEMARDGKLNNQKLIEQMLTEFLDGSKYNPQTGDSRDGIEAAATEIVMRYVGWPSLSNHESVCAIIRKEIKLRGIK